MIKWCLHLRHLSGSGYEALRKSGCITLPSQRTLRDYTHFATATSGFSCDVDRQLIDVTEIASSPEWKKSVVLLMDEMLVVMVRGLFSGLQFPYVQFPCGTLRGDQMFHILWKTVGRLERYGFRVMGLTCDGLAANRQLFRLHAPRGSTELVHKVTNPHSSDRRNFFFFSDPPHLLKTLRNCLANKNRHLWVSSDLSCCVLTSLDLCIVFCCSSTCQSAGATL